MRVIGMDVHRAFAQVAVLEGTQIVEQKRVELEHDTVVEFGRSLRPDDEVVLEATGNTTAIVRLLSPFVRRVVIANPGEVRAIAHARVKTDKVDAVILAKLHASGFLPEVWAADDDTIGRRRMASERAALVRSVGRLKSRIQSILHTNLIPRYAGALFTKGGRIWLEKVPLPKDEKAMLFRHIDEFDRLTAQLRDLDRQLARRALDDPRARKLMTIAGVNAIVATTVLASIGEIGRFESAQKLASYFGLTPRIRQSGDRPAFHGHISRHGNAQARSMLVEAAWSASKAPGPLRSFFHRVRQKRGNGIAAVATARKIAVLVWHLLTKNEPYAYSRPAFIAMKMRKLELLAGADRAHGKAGPGRDYWITELRHREMALVEQVEVAYTRMVEGWTSKPKQPVKQPS